MNNKINPHGFTLIEIIITLILLSIISVVVSKFIVLPLATYNSSATRASLAEEAYLAIKTIKSDIKKSLPNSVRVSTVGNQVFMEMMLISGGGKYRVEKTASNTGDELDFTTTDSSFDMIGPPHSFKAGEKIVISNLGSPGYDAYNNDNTASYSGVLNVPVENIVITAKQFPLQSPNENFYIVDSTVSYVCDKSTRTIRRYHDYAPSSSQPVNVATLGVSSLVAMNVENCDFVYGNPVNSRLGIVGVYLLLKKNSEAIGLFGDTYVPHG